MKILLIDDHKLFSMSLKLILEENDSISLVKTCSSLEEIKSLDLNSYDILLVDINLNNISEESGLSLAQKLISEKINAKIVILTGYSRLMYEQRAKTIGAYGFLDKNIEPQNLITILKSIYLGNKYFENLSCDNEIYHDKLSEQEVNILELSRQGYGIEEIASKLYISRRTVFNHLNNIYSKLDVRNKQEAIYKAELLGYFTPI